MRYPLGVDERLGSTRHRAGVAVLALSFAIAVVWALADLPFEDFHVGIFWAVALFAGVWLLYGDQ